MTFTIIPHLAYVDFPMHFGDNVSWNLVKYSILTATSNEFGGTIQTSFSTSMNWSALKPFGSMTALLRFVKTLNLLETRQIIAVS